MRHMRERERDRSSNKQEATVKAESISDKKTSMLSYPRDLLLSPQSTSSLFDSLIRVHPTSR